MNNNWVRAWLAVFLLSLPCYAATITVTNCDDSGAGSLRQAITDANTSGADTIEFNIPNTDGGYVTEGGVSFWRIQPTTALPTISDNSTTIDGSTQTTNQTDTNTQGPEILIDGTSMTATSNGLTISSNNNLIKNLAINDFYYNSSSYGIKITGSSNRIYGCYLGPHPSGEAAAGNGYGIMITGGQNNIIGRI